MNVLSLGEYNECIVGMLDWMDWWKAKVVVLWMSLSALSLVHCKPLEVIGLLWEV